MLMAAWRGCYPPRGQGIIEVKRFVGCRTFFWVVRSSMPLPTFIVIGAMKGGTTNLHFHLATHPEICVSRPKETNYFLGREEYERGLDWYTSLFEEGTKAIGETSPNYTKRQYWGETAARIAEKLPEVKLIYVVRDPIQRVVSHYVHRYADGLEAKPISQAILADPGYIDTSRYAYQLEAYLEHFPRDQILILDSTRLRNAAVETLQRVYTFIGVDPNHVPDNLGVNFHDSAEKLRKSFVDRRIPSYKLRRLAQRILPAQFTQPQPFARPVLSDVDRRQLVDRLAPDAERFRKLTGETFSNWSV